MRPKLGRRVKDPCDTDSLPAQTIAREPYEFRQHLPQLVLRGFEDEPSLVHPPDQAQPKYMSKDCLKLKVKTEEV